VPKKTRESIPELMDGSSLAPLFSFDFEERWEEEEPLAIH